MRLSVVVPATDRPATLPRCIEALESILRPTDELHVVTEPPGLGPAAARNAGVAACRGDVVVFVDSDVVVRDDALDRLRRTLGDEQTVVAVFGSYDDRVTTRGLVAAYRNLLHHAVHQRHAGPVPTFWAGLGAVRRDAFLVAGGFDARRYPRSSVEDIELGGRLSRLGTIVLDPLVTGTHLKEWTLRSMVRTDVMRRGLPWIALLLADRHAPSTLNLGARERASAAIALATLIAAGRRRPVVAATCVASQALLNLDLFQLLHRHRGFLGVAAGLGLHTVHQLSAVATVPAGLLQAALRRSAGERPTTRAPRAHPPRDTPHQR